ncbi:hypothetical protein HELRODRAFT_167836 [Helobdella robusta]|uniref:Uncharacterized protein n=1 Tax=Helobdella robusta TaxID=6412 RepID=T1EZU9_HELRO|nr:hypothetical protein HELRODRAFT_167836 [Helobdella robusta]ESO09999.1 hypothetical protein HELRODRAFT_167836 [Helobdella robusta]
MAQMPCCMLRIKTTPLMEHEEDVTIHLTLTFCEVRAEVKKAWQQYQLKRKGNFRCSQTEHVYLDQFGAVGRLKTNNGGLQLSSKTNGINASNNNNTLNSNYSICKDTSDHKLNQYSPLKSPL